MGMIFNTTATLHIIKQLNDHYAEGANYTKAKDPGPNGDAAKFAAGSTTHDKSHSVGVNQAAADNKAGVDTWKKYLDSVIDYYNDPNTNHKFGVTIINAIENYFTDHNCIAIQFFAVYNATQSVTVGAPEGAPYYGTILVQSLSYEEAHQKQQLARGRPAARKGPRSGVQAPATRRRKKPEA